jgi:hypothetical protein
MRFYNKDLINALKEIGLKYEIEGHILFVVAECKSNFIINNGFLTKYGLEVFSVIGDSFYVTIGLKLKKENKKIGDLNEK